MNVKSLRLVMLPFTRDQFFAVFGSYNVEVWPAQIVAYVLGLAMVLLLLRPSPRNDGLITGGLAVMWLWTGFAYHWLYFSSINDAAWIFGALFALQAVLFLCAAVLGDGLNFGVPRGPSAWVGWTFVAYAAALYPLLGMWAGHTYPRMPMFGVTPCPVTIFTFGLLLLTTAPVPRWLLVIPFVWSLIGGSAASLLGVRQDWLLLASGVVAVGLIVVRDRARLHDAVTTHA